MVYKVNNEVSYEVVSLSRNRSFVINNHVDFMCWLARATLKTYYSGRYYLDFSDFNFSGTDLTCYVERHYNKEKESLETIVHYYLKGICVYRNGVPFDVRTLKDKIIPFRVSNPQLFTWDKKYDYDLKYGDILVKKGYRNDCKICFAYRKDPVPYVSRGNGRGRSSKIGNVVRMVHSEEYKEYGRPGRYPSCAWDFKHYEYYYSDDKCWKDCTKKRHQWER